ncbi:MAG: molybdopterin-dependent oxidoreductase [Planctomycetota bacterium]|nr:molybdopterin-dependent oxidoreductase [Planctomycetota bacterium]
MAVFVSPELSNEELYLASRIAREGLSTNNIGSISALHTGYAPDALDDAFGFTASTADRKAVRDADLIICNNTDTQSDQLILSVEIIDTVKDGAKLVVSNSIYDPLEELSSLQLDPMRGRSTFLWNGVIQHLISEGYFDLDAVNKLDGGEKFVADLAKYDLDATEMNSGVEVRKIRQTAEMLMDAQNVVLVHSPDRAFDSSPGDMQALANIVTLLREKGKKAQLLIPGMYSNTAGLALAGATPEFLPGRVRSHGLEGAENTDELYAKLEAGSIKAALVIGEDPFRHDKTASYFANTELLISMDWSKTETGMFANIAFPFSTYLESSGTRCNFEGRAVHFEGVVETPAGVPGWKMLAELASRFGLDVEKADVKKITAELVEKIEKGTGEMMPLYFNDGEDRQECSLKRALVVASAKPRAAKIPPAVTSIDAYKRQIHEVGRSFKVS